MSTNYHTPFNTGDPLDASEFNSRLSDLDSQITTLSGAGSSGGNPLGVVNGRLSLSSSDAVTTSDQTAATTLYLLPFRGDVVGLYSGTGWDEHNIPSAGVSLSVPTGTNMNHDVFLYDNGGTLTLETTAWTNATTRATALTLQDGVYVRSGALTRLYLGTIRTTGTSGQCEDSESKRFCWNYWNRVPRVLVRQDTTDSWTYAVATTYRQANADSANQVEAVVGVDEDVVDIVVQCYCYSGAGNYAAVGVGVDATNTNDAQTHGVFADANGKALTGRYIGHPGDGYHYFAWVEGLQGTATTTFTGDFNRPETIQSGMVGHIWG